MTVRPWRGQDNTPRQGRLNFRKGRDGRLLHRPIGEQLLDGRFHLRCVEIALYGEYDVRWKEISLVEFQYIFPLDPIDVFVFHVPTEGRGAPV